MSDNARNMLPGTVSRRTAMRFATALTIVAGSLAVPFAASPAQAADQFSCTGPAVFFNSTSTGTLVRRTYSTPGRAGGSWTAATTVGPAGWTTFGRLLGGPDGRVYGINSNGLTRYRYTGSDWENVDGKQAWLISSSFQGYAGTSFRDKITVDERGDFYVIDSTGKLRWYRFDEASKTWTIGGRVLDTGWDRYNLLVATSPGVLYGRAADGRLYRHRFDPVSQRWISRNRLVGSSGWGGFTKGLFSAGGDTLFGVQADGDLFQYRFREDTLSWELATNQIGNGWGGFPNVFTTTNACTQGAVASPARPATPIQADSPVAVMQAPAVNTSLGTLEVAYTDNIGQLRHGRANPDAVQEIQWSPVPGTEAYTGKPALVANSENKVAVFGHEVDSDVRMLLQKTAGMPDWNPWLELGGAMKSEPATVRLSDGKLVVFAIDASGALWYRWHENPTSDLMPWTPLGGSGFAGRPVVVAGANGAATVLVNTAAGTPQVATWQAGALTSGWTSLGDTGLTGTPSTVLLPGPRLMVFGTHTDGSVRTQVQNTDGTWPATWTTIGASAVVPQGAPTAVLSPTSGRVWVFVRGADGTIYGSVQTAAGSATWNAWTAVTSGETYVSDPTAFTWQNSGGSQIGFAVRTLNGSVRLWATDQSNSTAARTAVKTDGPFVRHDLPAPPR
ncbi:tachylectin-related carbohydrate-binding protein [Micromonospora sp. BQ11]|uniref:tachylectin-related carbohydrate-binding protein n=1 Tax=Micromonospora sp. BQ11 TaxID=3452212 RepID=UPI003F886F76